MTEQIQKSRQLKGALITLFAGCLWGFSGSCGQYIFTYKQVVAGWLVPIRLTVGGAVLLAILFAKNGRRAADIWRGAKNARNIAVFAIFGMMLCQYSYFSAIQYSNAGTATVLQYLGPAMIMLLMCVKTRIPPTKREVLAVILAVGGTLLLATHGNLGNLAISPAALFWGLIAAVTLVIYSVQPTKMIAEFGSMAVTGWGMLAGGLVLALFFRPWTIPVVFDGQCLLLLAVIILATITAFTCYMEGVNLIGPVKASLLACIEPVSATVISALWLKTPFAALDFLGFAMIISTVFLLTLKKK